jgi:4-oxalocrotonate tautomerase
MPYVHIDWVAGQSPEKRDDVAKRVSTAVSEVTGIALADIWVVFKDIDADAWYVGDRSVREIRSGKK